MENVLKSVVLKRIVLRKNYSLRIYNDCKANKASDAKCANEKRLKNAYVQENNHVRRTMCGT